MGDVQFTHNGTYTRTAGCVTPCAIGGIECDFTEVEIEFILGHKTAVSASPHPVNFRHELGSSRSDSWPNSVQVPAD